MLPSEFKATSYAARGRLLCEKLVQRSGRPKRLRGSTASYARVAKRVSTSDFFNTVIAKNQTMDTYDHT